jgi:hypothetical protein
MLVLRLGPASFLSTTNTMNPRTAIRWLELYFSPQAVSTSDYGWLAYYFEEEPGGGALDSQRALARYWVGRSLASASCSFS